MGDTLFKLRMGIMLTLTALLGHALVNSMGLAPLGVDDANILFVYSKHFAAGEGLVYNIGGERVEGFSSMLWMLLTSVGYLFFDRPYPFFFAINVLLVGGVLGYTLHFVVNRFGSDDVKPGLPATLPGVLFIAWVAANPSYILWTIASLMETGLWSVLLIGTTVLLLKIVDAGVTDARSVRLLALLNAAIVLTRPEGIAWVLSFATLLLLAQRQQGAKTAQMLRGAGLVAGAGVLTLGALVLFRLGYFGFPLPNTYYVKVTPDKLYNLRFGLVYFIEFIQANPFATLFVVGAVAGALRNVSLALRTLFGGDTSMSAARLGEFCVSCIVLVGMLLPILMGGDIFGAFRFYQPVWPLLIIVLFYLAPDEWWRQRSRAITLAAGLAALCAFTLTSAVRWPNVSEDHARVAHLFELSERGMQTGAYLEQWFAASPDGLPSSGLSAAGGKIGYAGWVMDTMGLNFLPMAHHAGDKKGTRGHAAFDKEVFWAYATDLLEPTLCPRSGPPVNRYRDPGNWIYVIYRGLLSDPEFVARYRFVALDVPGAERRVCTYISNELLAKVRATDRLAVELVD